jgi:predicted ATPase
MGELARPVGHSVGAAADRFKRDASIAVLAAAGGVAGVGEEPFDAPSILACLDQWVREFAGGRIVPQLQLQREGGLWLSVALPSGHMVPFDALSSGQKEIISTLFLIWQATRDCPSVVLIDEPELHLHQEWHDDFMRALFELAPHNQYIIATHSRRIAECVYPDRLRTIQP